MRSADLSAGFGTLDVTEERMAEAEAAKALDRSFVHGTSLAREMQDAFRSIDYQDADGDIDDLDSYRSIAYQLSRTNEIAIAGLDKLELSIIGTGLRLQPDINRMALERVGAAVSDDQIDDIEAEIEDDFATWAENPELCDVEQKFTFYDHQRLALRTEKAAGDSFALIARRSAAQAQTTGYLTALQAIAPARVCNKDNDFPSRKRTGGVVRNAQGAVVAYDIRLTHPDTMKLDTGLDEQWTTVPRYARSGRQNVIHMMSDAQVDQSRGRPLLAPIAKTIARISKFSDAQVMAALVQAFFAIYFENEGGGTSLSYGEAANAAGNTPMNADGSVDLKEGTGIVGGAKPHMLASTHPGPHLDQFFAAMLTNVGMALNIPVEVLTNKFHESYSASRAAMLEFWKTVSLGRHQYTLKMCKPIYAAYLRDRVSQGIFDMPGFQTDPRARMAWCGSIWLGDARGAIDKRAETGPEIDMIRAGIRAPSMYSEEYNGIPYRAMLRRESRDKRMRDAEGLEPPQQEPKLFEVSERIADEAMERQQQMAPPEPGGTPPNTPPRNNRGNDDDE